MDRDRYYSELYSVVKKNIDALDCYHLLEGGAPDDEFDIEIEDICNRIKPECGAEDISNIINSVFKRWLGVEYYKENTITYVRRNCACMSKILAKIEDV